MPNFIPFHCASLGDAEVQEVSAVLRSGWLTTGERAHQFEQDYCSYSGASHTLALNSGTAALHLALVALDIRPGDEVVSTPLTFCATINAILHTGATPVLADVDEHGNIDPASITERITPRTRALLPVHLAGRVCDMDAIWRIAEAYKLHVVEDAAHAAGSSYHLRPLGAACVSRSQVTAFSFYATKNITTGEGGMATTNNPALAARMRTLALHGISKDAWNRYAQNGNWFYQVLEPGFKYNMSDIQAAIGIHQLKHIDAFAEARRRIAAAYTLAFRNVEELETPSMSAGIENSWHLYPLRLRLDRLQIDRAQFIEELRQGGIGTSVHFIPIPMHPCYWNWPTLAADHCPRAMALYPRLVSLPLYPSLSEEQVERVIGAVQDVVVRNRRPILVGGSSSR